MIYAYIGKNKKLCLRPADPEGEKELREFLQQLKQVGLEAIDVETEMSEENHEHYKRYKRHGNEYAGNKEFGFSPTGYFPPGPDYNPQSHRFFPPFVFPFWYGDDTDGGYDSRRGRDGRGGRGGRDGRGRGRDMESRRGRGGKLGTRISPDRYGYDLDDDDLDD
jgi:hypothetical protein